MDLQKISKILSKNDWFQLEVELDSFLLNPTDEIQEFILENLDEVFFNKKSNISLIYFFKFGQHFSGLGKVYIAQKMFEIYFEKIFQLKKIQDFLPRFEEVKAMGLSNKKLQERANAISQILGNKESYKKGREANLILENLHEAYWGDEKNWLKNQVLISKINNVLEYKRAIYFLKKYGRDEQVVEKIKNEFPEVFKSQKTKTSNEKESSKYKFNYDDLALEMLKNPTLPNLEETKVINYLKFNLESEEELKEKINAFKFLGMNRVVSYIATELIKNEESEKELVNLEFIRIDAELEQCNFHKARDLAVEVLNTRSLLKSEETLFWYTLGETYFHLKDFVNAKNCYSKITKEFPNYRLLKERLKEIEKNK